MNIELFRNYCLAKPMVTEGFPFGSDTLVFKVAGKMFALTGIDTFKYVNLKCDPERAVTLREEYPGITPGYHMSKTHWNSVTTDDSLSDDFFLELTDHSYNLVVKGLPKRIQNEITGQHEKR